MALFSLIIFFGILLSSAAEIRDTRWFWRRTKTSTAFQWLLCFPLGTRPSGRVFFCGLWVPVLDGDWASERMLPVRGKLSGGIAGLQFGLPFRGVSGAFVERWVQWHGSLGFECGLELRHFVAGIEILLEIAFEEKKDLTRRCFFFKARVAESKRKGELNGNGVGFGGDMPMGGDFGDGSTGNNDGQGPKIEEVD
ncbi:elongation of fatty acids protein 3-like [Tripterygium wilfordii]|uniref:Elongation of fatty acids protein 3-like n=1 Tax=Tripterygium wilfordii TaxID=458696 RepID=A0A7J7CZ60_TRIWF|nr:elongation of fatty acids protein 3-like [Tripterygium wilfordii]